MRRRTSSVALSQTNAEGPLSNVASSTTAATVLRTLSSTDSEFTSEAGKSRAAALEIGPRTAHGSKKGTSPNHHVPSGPDRVTSGEPSSGTNLESFVETSLERAVLRIARRFTKPCLHSSSQLPSRPQASGQRSTTYNNHVFLKARPLHFPQAPLRRLERTQVRVLHAPSLWVLWMSSLWVLAVSLSLAAAAVPYIELVNGLFRGGLLQPSVWAFCERELV
jgi:hypothetical protein